MMQKIIVLDPGHGSTRGTPGFDPGVTFGNRTEAEANLEAALTLKALLVQLGYKIVLTHDGHDGAKPDLSWRVRMAANLGAAAFISLHYDMKFTPSRHLSGVYAAPGVASWKLAQALTGARCMAGGWCRSSSSSRFNGLYIDAFPDAKPSVLIELDSIEFAPPTGEAGKAARLARLTPIANTIHEFLR